MDSSGDKYSKKPLPKARAERQLKALHINTGHGLYGGRLEETWPMLKESLDELTQSISWQTVSIPEQKKQLEKYMESIILEMNPLIDEKHEKKELITRGTTYIGQILSQKFPSPTMQETKEGLSEISRKPIGHILGNVNPKSELPVFKTMHISQYPTISKIKTNPSEPGFYFKSYSTTTPTNTEADVTQEIKLEDTLQKLLDINKLTGEYYDELKKHGYNPITPEQAKKLKNGSGRYSEPDTHILIGDYLSGGIAVKLIKNADKTFSIADMKDKILETVSTKEEAVAALSKWYKYDPTKVVHKPVATKDATIDWAARLGEGKYKFVKKYLKGQGLPATKKNVAKICNIMDVEGVVFD
jgi:hypothetical protein